MNGKSRNHLYSEKVCFSQTQLWILIILILIAYLGFNLTYAHVFGHEQNVAAGFGQILVPFLVKQGRFDERGHFSDGKKNAILAIPSDDSYSPVVEEWLVGKRPGTKTGGDVCFIATADYKSYLIDYVTVLQSSRAIFVPEYVYGSTTYYPVPLSCFYKVKGNDAGTVHFLVAKCIKDYIDGIQGAQVLAINDQGTRSIASYDGFNTTYKMAQYSYSYPANSDGKKYTLICNLLGFHNNFPLVTHWNATYEDEENYPDKMGKPEEGATGHIGSIDWDPSLAGRGITYPGDVYGTPNLLKSHTDYYINAVDYGLFRGDPTFPEALVSDYERYPEENYEINGVTNMRAIKFSEDARTITGYPVIFRNFPQGETALTKVNQSIPAFQLLHNVIITPTIDSREVTHKQSLASFLLPPEWTSTPSSGKEYPMVINGEYGTSRIFFIAGFHFFEVYEKVLGEHPYDFSTNNAGIVVAWNTGGSSNTLGLHESVKYCATEMINLLESDFGTDPDLIVAAGGSRGGLQTFNLICNDQAAGDDDYTVVYGIPLSPFMGRDTLGWDNFNNMTHQGPLYADGLTNYTGAWEIGWSQGGLNAEEKLWHNMTGSTTGGYLDFVDNVASEGTIMVSIIGTHDATMDPLEHLKFHAKADDAGVDIRTEIYYRGGHTPDPYKGFYNYICLALKDLIDNRNSQQNPADIALFHRLSGSPAADQGKGVFHYKKVNGNWSYFKPSDQPIFLEAPRLAWSGNKSNFLIVGEEGYEFCFQIWNGTQKLYETIDTLKQENLGTQEASIYLTPYNNSNIKISWWSTQLTFGTYSHDTTLTYKLKFRPIPNEGSWLEVGHSLNNSPYNPSTQPSETRPPRVANYGQLEVLKDEPTDNKGEKIGRDWGAGGYYVMKCWGLSTENTVLQIFPIMDQEVYEKKQISLSIEGKYPEEEDVTCSVKLIDGNSLSTIGATFTDDMSDGTNIGEFTWTPQKYQGKKDYYVEFFIHCDGFTDVKIVVKITVLIPGDFDKDDDVDGTDLYMFNAAYDTTIEDEDYNPEADFDNDGDVDESDICVFSSNFGRIG